MKLEDIDFEPRKVQATCMFIVTLLGYGLGLGSAIYYGLKQSLEVVSSSPANLFEVVFIILAYSLGFFFLLLYAVFNPYRFTFMEQGAWVYTWRGRQFFAWHKVERATLSSYKGHIDLSLRLGRLRYIAIPLSSYKKGGRLLAEVRRRLPVEVEVSKEQAAMLEDE